MLQHLYGIYVAADDEEANQAPAAFIEVWQDTGLDEFDRLVATLLEWETKSSPSTPPTGPATAESKARTTSSASTGRVAYGFVNTTNFAARALLLTPGMPT
jgi:transposase